MAYKTLDDSTIVDYARSKTDVFPAGAQLEGKEFGDGNLNLIFRVTDTGTGKSIVIKQALPHARIDDSIVTPLERARIESEMLVLHDKYAPGLAPEIYFYDPDMYAIGMQDLADHQVLRQAMIEGKRFPGLAEHLGDFVAKSTFATTDVGMDQQDKKRMVANFINPELCKITEDLIFSEPYFDAPGNKIDPEIRERAEENVRDTAYRKEVAILKEKFMTQAQALIHGDLHTGSVFVKEGSTKAFDPEFGFFGPIGFDLGLIMGNLIPNHASQLWHKRDDADDRAAYRAWIEEVFAGIWTRFDKTFRDLWKQNVKTPMESNPAYLDDYMARLFSDAIGYAATAMVRRIVGLAQVKDIRSIPDAEVRAKAQIQVLDIGREFTMRRTEYRDIDEVVETIRKHTV